ncbi:DinB family protein [Salimicrobium flavidum]|uniref:DinB superfamily protein n=1 Tax=Salimicrobium flavidum TaxID=570947 RepID=A0A1N7KMV5_9BACI|nr:DinB family protein [Salimicrobium flavidum]SIS62871.1 DinB superfamily protein [Salimicrobium flavidum]
MNRKKEEILSHCAQSLNQVHSLENLTEEQWRTPIAEGKWTIAEVVGHLIPWDKYFIGRIPKIINEEDELPYFAIEEVNGEASVHSKNSSKEKIIHEFLDVRKLLIAQISDLDDKLWEREFHVGDETFSLYEDLSRLVKHDEDHFAQIDRVL